MLWLDGVVHSDACAPFDTRDRGLLLGDGVFDTSLVLGGRVFLGEAHLARLVSALDVLGIAPPLAQIREAVAALAPQGERHVLRVTVTRGAGLRGLAPQGEAAPTVLASLAPLPEGFAFPKLSMALASIRRNETSPVSRIKALSYLDAILAMRAAVAEGCNEALFLNGAGRVACASIGNVFALFGRELATPPVEDGVLAGIIRGFLLERAGSLGLEARARPLELAELAAADAVFMTNSLRLIAPIERIGALALAAKAAKIIAELQELLRQAIRAECARDP